MIYHCIIRWWNNNEQRSTIPFTHPRTLMKAPQVEVDGSRIANVLSWFAHAPSLGRFTLHTTMRPLSCWLQHQQVHVSFSVRQLPISLKYSHNIHETSIYTHMENHNLILERETLTNLLLSFLQCWDILMGASCILQKTTLCCSI